MLFKVTRLEETTKGLRMDRKEKRKWTLPGDTPILRDLGGEEDWWSQFKKIDLPIPKGINGKEERNQ